ncbi:hypothetical protein ACFL2R_01420 [Patescibacteria group bacterium]
MANINLHQSVEHSESLREKPSFFANRTFISILILVIFASVFVGLKYYQDVLNKKKQALADKKQQEMMTMDRDSIREVVDFKKKISGITYNIEHKTDPRVNLGQMERLLLSDVAISKYVYYFETGNIEIGVIADDFESIAEQMWNFKKSKEFSSVEVVDSALDSEGKTVFNLVLTMN